MTSIAITNDSPAIIALEDLYDPSKTDEENNQKIIPAVDSLVVDGSTMYIVTAVDPTTHEATLSAPYLVATSEDPSDTVSVVSYANDIFRVYYTNRTSPTKLAIDSRLIITGSINTSYQLSVKNSSGEKVVISRYYDEDGNFLSTSVPMGIIYTDSPNAKYCRPCNTTATITDGQSVLLEVFNTFGEVTAQVNLFARESVFENTLDSYIPSIVSIEINSSQKAEDGDIYIYETQDVRSLNITAKLTYDNGFIREISTDGEQCISYGINDFVPSYPGLRQPIMIKYFLSEDELSSADVVTVSGVRYISATTHIVVRSEDIVSSMKLSVVPLWDSTQSKYYLRYFAYDIDGEWMEDVTVNVTTTPTFNGINYGTWQTIVASIDKKNIVAIGLNKSSIYQQSFAVQVQPISIYERYVLADVVGGDVVYGVEAGTSRRPILSYDSTISQYFIPTTVFENVEAVIEAFYTNATPPYDTSELIAPVTPTHFIVRDSLTGASVTAIPMSLETYGTAFNVTGAPINRFLGQTVIVEFLKYVDESTYLTLFGVPVDVKSGVYQG